MPGTAIAPADAGTVPHDTHGSTVPAFHPHDEVAALPGVATSRCIMVNLGIGENNQTAVWLAEEVFAVPVSNW